MSSLKKPLRHGAIIRAEDVGALRSIREMEQQRLMAELSVDPVRSVMEALGEMHDALIARTIRLAETELARLGLGSPPVPYAYLLFGSGGREEQTFSSDQDSGIVYGNPSSEAEREMCEAYFSRLAATVVTSLIELGYPPCEGNVLSSNPAWRMPLRDWEEQIAGWFADPGWEHVRYLLIVADARIVFGDETLMGKLRSRFFSDMLQSPVIARRMMENTLRHKVLIGVFGQLLREPYGEEAGSLDIKYGAYIPMVNLFRLMAVQGGVRETSTFGRIAALRESGALDAREADEADETFELLLRMRLLTAVKSEGGQWIGSGKIPKEQLTKAFAQQLKKALKFGKKMQRRVAKEMMYRFGGR